MKRKEKALNRQTNSQIRAHLFRKKKYFLSRYASGRQQLTDSTSATPRLNACTPEQVGMTKILSGKPVRHLAKPTKDKDNKKVINTRQDYRH